MFICAFESGALGRIVFIAETAGKSPVVDQREENFFAGAFDFEWVNARLSPQRVLEYAVKTRQPAVVAMFQNADVLVDRALLLRILDVIADCNARFGVEGWLIAAPEGVDENGLIHSAVYSLEEPAFFAGRSPRAIAAVAPDAYVVNIRAFEKKQMEWPKTQERPQATLVESGYRNGLVSVFHPRFALPVSARTTPRLEAGAPPISAQDDDAASAFREVVAAAAAAASVSIVVRSIFNRPHLLSRLLVSILRAQIPRIPVEVIIASDVPDAARKFAAVAQDHPRLAIRFVETPPGEEPSRNRNLRAGAAAAQHDYVWFIDDDDYVDIFAFSHLVPAFFGGARPLIFAGADVHEERWIERVGGPPVLSQTRKLRDYSAGGWRDLFIGFNRIPVCGCLAPREFLVRSLASLSLRHDLSEDYALFLALLTAQGLPEIVEIGHSLSHISQRTEGENTMQMTDRTPWVRNITSYLSDVSYESASPGAFQLLRARSETTPSNGGEA